MFGSRLFESGEIRITKAARAELDAESIDMGLCCHLQGDWGDVSTAQKITNAEAVLLGGEIISRYEDCEGDYFQVKTLEDRSKTIILMDWE